MKSLRLYFRFTQEEWAKALGVTVRTVQRWESTGGKIKPSPLAQEKIDYYERKRKNELLKVRS